jgi:hypothetical protein
MFLEQRQHYHCVGENSMKKLAILFLLLKLFLNAWPAKADTIITGDLDFVCRGGCSATFTAPTFSSFAYDRADKQLFIEAEWDGITWDWDFQGLSNTFYQALTGSGPFVAHWSAWCITGPADIPPACGDNGIGFQLYLFSADGTVGGPAVDGIGTSTGTIPVFDVAAGTVTISTPEPATVGLVLVGIIILLFVSTLRRKVESCPG